MLNVKALALGGTVASAVTYIVCAVAATLAPQAVTRLAGAVIHADLSGIERQMTLGLFFGGLVFWAVLGAVFFALVGFLYNRFLRQA